MTSEAYHMRKRKKKRSSIWNTGWEEDEEIEPLDCCEEILELLETIKSNQSAILEGLATNKGILDAHTLVLDSIQDCACNSDPPFVPILPDPGKISISFENQGLVSMNFAFQQRDSRNPHEESYIRMFPSGTFSMGMVWTSAISFVEVWTQLLSYLKANNVPITFTKDGSGPGSADEATMLLVANRATNAIWISSPNTAFATVDFSKAGSLSWGQANWPGLLNWMLATRGPRL